MIRIQTARYSFPSPLINPGGSATGRKLSANAVYYTPIGEFDVFLEAQLKKEKEKGGGIYTTAASAFEGGAMVSLVGTQGYTKRMYADYRSAKAAGMVEERRAFKNKELMG